MPTHRIDAREPRHGAGRRATEIERDTGTVHAYLEDAAHFAGGHADGVARPRTEQDVAALLAQATRVLPIGAQSSLTGGATPDGGLVLSTARMVSIQASGQEHVRVGAGVSIAMLQELLKARGRWYAPAPTYTGAFAGGVVATNAAGAATFKYGTTRRWTDGLTVVLACGHVIDIVRGEVVAEAGGFELHCPCGVRTIRPGTYTMPDVPKCSAGYYAAPDMDLVDLFVGAEGTLGVVTEVTFRVLPRPPAVAWALVAARTDAAATAIVAALRDGSQATWRTKDPNGLDVSAIEYLDRRCLDILHEDGIDRKCDIAVQPDTAVMLLVQLELPSGTSPAAAFQQAGAALTPEAPDTPLVRFCRLLHEHDALGDTQMAWPGDGRRVEQFLAFREAAPAGVNRRVGDVKRDVDPRVEKTAADMIVPFEHFDEMLAIYREGYWARGLDYAIWGHISDGNVHPNVIPRSYADVEAGCEAILAFGRAAARLGGCPLAEHGVGRSRVKQALLHQLYGDEGIDEMRAIKHTLDPKGILSPGVLFEN